MQARWMAAAAVAAAAAGIVGVGTETAARDVALATLTFSNPRGVHRTFSAAGSIDVNNPFFQDLGTNGRTCFTCHRPAQAWTITPEEVQERFERTAGLDPIFRTNDGSNCEAADLSTLEQRREAFSLLLAKGLIRVGMPVPGDAEFNIIAVDDPHGCNAPFDAASLYRRPLPSTNLAFLSAVMWDGRESAPGHAIRDGLLNQANGATVGHAQGVALTPAQREAIVDFEMGLFTAQVQDRGAGSLRAEGARGGPEALAVEPFCIGINDPLGLLPAMPGACGAPSPGLDPVVFTLFTSWDDADSAARRAIARGERLFNTREFVIDDVAGLNAGPGDPVAAPFRSTCTICHNTPNAGDHSIAMPLDIGIAAAEERTPDLPLYTLQHRTTFETVQTSDPGRAMVTGKWADIGKFKGPILRALAARAPYFHNGSAASLEEVVDFYDRRFNIGLTPQEKTDLVAFLAAL